MRTLHKLAALLIVALVFSGGECAAACAFASCHAYDPANSVPPCHRHGRPASRQNPAPCGHELQLLGPDASSLSQDSAADLLVAAAPAPVVIESQPDLIAEALHVPLLSPPQLSATPLFVLRI
jgi:hypothetical protein